MRPFVFTIASVVWILCSILSLVLMFYTVNSAQWLEVVKSPYNETVPLEDGGFEVVQKNPKMGISIRCIPIQWKENCGHFGDSDAHFPPLWRISHIFFITGVCLLFATTFGTFITCYFPTACRVSTYHIVGGFQAFVGFLFLNGFIFYICGWGHERVKRYCGPEAGPFSPGDCELGLAMYYAMLGVIVTFISACVSTIAARTISRYRVTKRINEGNKFICMY